MSLIPTDIDKGVKRNRSTPQRDPQTQRYLPVVTLTDEALLERVRGGEYISEIAESVGVTGPAISQRYAARPDYQEARKAGAERRLETAEREIQGAGDPLTLARAREWFRAVAWRCEREYPERWGPKSHVTVEQVGDLADRLRRAKERTIEGECVAESPNAALLPPESDT